MSESYTIAEVNVLRERGNRLYAIPTKPKAAFPESGYNRAGTIKIPEGSFRAEYKRERDLWVPILRTPSLLEGTDIPAFDIAQDEVFRAAKRLRVTEEVIRRNHKIGYVQELVERALLPLQPVRVKAYHLRIARDTESGPEALDWLIVSDPKDEKDNRMIDNILGIKGQEDAKAALGTTVSYHLEHEGYELAMPVTEAGNLTVMRSSFYHSTLPDGYEYARWVQPHLNLGQIVDREVRDETTGERTTYTDIEKVVNEEQNVK